MAFESITLERILAKDNLYKALRQAETKNGAPRVDGLKARRVLNKISEADIEKIE